MVFSGRVWAFYLVVICYLYPAETLFGQNRSFDFYGTTFNYYLDPTSEVAFDDSLNVGSIRSFNAEISRHDYDTLISRLLKFKKDHELNDWIFYQLVRRTAESISPKLENYPRYTLYKWFLMTRTGYDARLAVGNGQLVFYIRNEENINDIPFFIEEGHKYMCLNYHDYRKVDFSDGKIRPVLLKIAGAESPFSYKVTRLPDFKPESYSQKDIEFQYRNRSYHFQIKVNQAVEKIFTNYPGVDFATYFNIPLSRETYGSLIPHLQKSVQGMNQKRGVDYLMRFTRYAFLYESDDLNFGREKRLSPEQTLLADYSDCDDRAALFFYLVKEIYDLPMIALLYPTHITMAVQFDRPVGKSIVYKGERYTVCEATPQEKDLKLGELSATLSGQKFEIVYQYDPEKNKSPLISEPLFKSGEY